MYLSHSCQKEKFSAADLMFFHPLKMIDFHSRRLENSSNIEKKLF